MRKNIELADLGVEISEDLKKYFENIEIQAGILQDALYRNGTSLKNVASILQGKYGWLEKGIQTGENSDLKKAVDIVVKGLLTGHFTEQQFINAIKACFINPINRKEFGHNAESTKRRKGFDKVMVETGKFIKSINANIERTNNV